MSVALFLAGEGLIPPVTGIVPRKPEHPIVEIKMRINSRVLLIGFLFLLKFLFGIWLSHSGKPYHVVLLTIHKIISLVTVALIGITVYRLRRNAGIDAVEIGAIIVTGLLFLLAILSGGLVSADRPTDKVLSLVHKVTPFLTVLSTAVTVYLVIWAK